jgi:hypothetical protein
MLSKFKQTTFCATATIGATALNITPQINRELKDYANWVLWGDSINPKTGEITPKMPFNANSNSLAKARPNNPKTWANYAKCVEVFKSSTKYKSIKGIGFVFSDKDPYFGIDLDDCYDENNKLSPLAIEIKEKFNTYTERSPSRKGIHLIGKVSDKEIIIDLIKSRTKTHNKCKNNGIELYFTNHYFTYTGDCIGISEINTISKKDITDFHDKYFKKRDCYIKDNCIIKSGMSPDLSKSEILSIISKSSNYAEFEKYYYGGKLVNNDNSATDMAVMNYLIFYCQNYDKIIDIFLDSEHIKKRNKDNEKVNPETDRGKIYLERTFRRALDDCENFYQPKHYGYTALTKDGLLITISNFKLKPKVRVNDDNEVWYDVDIVTKGKKYNKIMRGSDLSDVKSLQKWIATIDASLSYEYKSVKPVKLDFENIKEVNPVTHGFNYINGKWRFVDNINYDDVIVKDKEILGKYKLDLVEGTPGNLFSYNADKISIPTTLTSVAFYFNARLEKLDISLPVLKVTGEPESGKTTTLDKTINKLFNLKKTNERSAKSTTDFVYRRDSESSTFKPLSITEIGEADERHINIITNVVKHAYDRGSTAIGNKYQTLNVYQYKSPIIISGQTSTGFEDMAIKDRAIEVCFSKVTIADPKYKNKLEECNFEALRKPLIEYIEKVSDEKLLSFYNKPDISGVTPRSENNIRVLMIAAAVLKEIGYSVPDNTLEVLIENYKNNHTAGMSIIGMTLKHIKRMADKLYGNEYHQEHEKYYSINIEKVYPLYTKYIKTYNILFNPLSEEDFKQQFIESEFNSKPGTYKDVVKINGKSERRILIKLDKWNELE